MNNKLLDQLLNLLREEDLPSCPAAVEANVLRKIRLRLEEERWPFRAEFARFAMQPRLAATALAIGIFSSAVTTFLATDLSARPEPQSPEVAQVAKVLELRPFQHDRHLLECCRPGHHHGR